MIVGMNSIHSLIVFLGGCYRDGVGFIVDTEVLRWKLDAAKQEYNRLSPLVEKFNKAINDSAIRIAVGVEQQ